MHTSKRYVGFGDRVVRAGEVWAERQLLLFKQGGKWALCFFHVFWGSIYSYDSAAQFIQYGKLRTTGKSECPFEVILREYLLAVLRVMRQR